MIDLVKFLTVRLAEIGLEARNRTVHHIGCDRVRCDCAVPEYLLADVRAKQRIFEWCVEVIGPRDLTNYGQLGCLADDPDGLAVTLAVETLRLFATPFAFHPDYQPEWTTI